jgi:hypothetical protein
LGVAESGDENFGEDQIVYCLAFKGTSRARLGDESKNAIKMVFEPLKAFSELGNVS